MSVPDWPSDDREWPADEQLPWAREALRQNLIDPEYDGTENQSAFRGRLMAEAADRGWKVEIAEPDGGCSPWSCSGKPPHQRICV